MLRRTLKRPQRPLTEAAVSGEETGQWGELVCADSNVCGNTKGVRINVRTREDSRWSRLRKNLWEGLPIRPMIEWVGENAEADYRRSEADSLNRWVIDEELCEPNYGKWKTIVGLQDSLNSTKLDTSDSVSLLIHIINDGSRIGTTSTSHHFCFERYLCR